MGYTPLDLLRVFLTWLIPLSVELFVVWFFVSTVRKAEMKNPITNLPWAREQA